MMTLYDYFRSSAAYRVRIALNLKGLRYTLNEIHLVRDGGEQYKAAYKTINPQGRVPAFTDGHITLTQSMAILEYLEEKYPEVALLPKNLTDRAYVRALANIVACDIHPLNNLSVLKYLQNELSVSDEDKMTWYAHWIHEGFTAFEAQIKETQGQYCLGDQVTLADICLIPQVYNANRFKIDLTPYPNIVRINGACLSLSAFAEASPKEPT